MEKIKRFIFVASLFTVMPQVGCGLQEKAYQDEAVDIVWVSVYERSESPPSILWRSDCFGPAGQAGVTLPAFSPMEGINAGTCVASYYEPDLHEAIIAWPGSFAASGLSEELANAAICDDGPCIPQQQIPAWHYKVDTAHAALAALGL